MKILTYKRYIVDEERLKITIFDSDEEYIEYLEGQIGIMKSLEELEKSVEEEVKDEEYEFPWPERYTPWSPRHWTREPIGPRKIGPRKIGPRKKICFPPRIGMVKEIGEHNMSPDFKGNGPFTKGL